MSTSLTDPPGRAGRRRAWVVALGAVATLGVVVGWWASMQGYVAWFGAACTEEGYPDPLPSYTELVEQHGKSPYCARRVRGETWF